MRRPGLALAAALAARGPALALAAALAARGPALALAAAGRGTGAAGDGAAAEASPEAVRGELVERLNALREGAGVPALRRLPALDQVAQERAVEIGEAGALPDEANGTAVFGRIQGKLARAGYLAHQWTESVTAAPGSLEAVVGYFREQPQYALAMRPDFSEIGIGLARYQGVPLYLLLLSWPENEQWRREITPLADLERVRREMLDRVNVLRREAGRPPLLADARLDQAAQRHAADMLARSYYGHQSPDGASPRERIRAAGYPASLVAENIAARHVTVEEAMAGWTSSASHRRNLLDPRFTSLGIGVAAGSYDQPYQVLWVQDFASP